MVKQKRLGVILNSPQYKEYCKAIADEEYGRIFCHHDMAHFAAVARVAYILYLTEEISCPELNEFSREESMDIIYAVGFLHDIGRFLEYRDPQKDHAVESERLSRPFLEEAGFSLGEQEVILKAIRNHRCKDTQGFDQLIYFADKKSRDCLGCKGIDQCKKYTDGRLPEVMI